MLFEIARTIQGSWAAMQGVASQQIQQCCGMKEHTCALWVVRARCDSRSRRARDQRVLRIMNTPMSSAERP